MSWLIDPNDTNTPAAEPQHHHGGQCCAPPRPVRPMQEPEYLEAHDQPVFIARRIGEASVIALFALLVAWVGLELLGHVIVAYREVRDVL